MALTHIGIYPRQARREALQTDGRRRTYLVVQPKGAKLWRMNYWHSGRQRTLYFSAWPDLSIAAARVKRDEVRSQLALGVDPAAEKKAAELAERFAASNTFKAVAEEWTANHQQRQPRSEWQHHL